MRCPACTDELLVLEWERVEVDHCTNCKGIWLDGGELEVLLEDAHAKESVLASFQKCERSSDERKCPICLKKMEQVYCGADRVALDRCPSNHGLWFDLGELHQILRSATVKDSKLSAWLSDVFVKKESS